MVPTLRSGETVLYDPRAYARRPPRVGDVVVLPHPGRPELTLIKRVHAVSDDAWVDVRGDNPTGSTDSRDFGPVPCASLTGRATCRFLPAFARDERTPAARRERRGA